MTTPERSVEEIVNKYWAKKMTLALAQDLERDINDLLQAERQKREEIVEAERERILEVIDDCDGWYETISDYKDKIKDSLTQTNNPK